MFRHILWNLSISTVRGNRQALIKEKAEYEKPFAYEQEYKEKLARQAELNAELDLENKIEETQDMEEERNMNVAEKEYKMKYTVKVNKVKKNDGSLRGFATVVFGGSFKITNIAILESSEGKLFVSMPRYRSSEVDEHNQTVYKDICNPITAEFRAELYGDILKEYENMTEHGKVQIDDRDIETEMPEFKVTPFEREGSNIRGLGRIYLDDCFVINNVSLV